MNGYILISRSIIESEIWRKPPLYLKVWIWLLINAQFKKYKDLDRGELVTSIEEIRQACAYYSGYRKEVPTKKQIYSILEWLRNPHGRDNGRDAGGSMVVTTAVTEGICVNICNFNKYQAPQNYGGDSGGNAGRDTGGTTDGNPTLLKKKEKKENNNNNNNIPPSVEEVRAYCQSRKNNVDPEAFIDFYDSKGWYVGKNKMKDWRAAVRNWERSGRASKSAEEVKPKKYAEYKPEEKEPEKISDAEQAARVRQMRER